MFFNFFTMFVTKILIHMIAASINDTWSKRNAPAEKRKLWCPNIQKRGVARLDELTLEKFKCNRMVLIHTGWYFYISHQLSAKANIARLTSTQDPIYIFPERKLRARSQFLHSRICERFIYFHDRSSYFAAENSQHNMADRSWEYINRSQIHAFRNW